MFREDDHLSRSCPPPLGVPNACMRFPLNGYAQPLALLADHSFDKGLDNNLPCFLLHLYSDPRYYLANDASDFKTPL
jgi:hypothetical protein